MMLKKCIMFALGLLLSVQLTAQVSDYAYVYIEGDKETPFYVKMEGKMVPRLGQNYTILSNLDAGITNIEILFQQNKYAPLRFAINVPKHVGRGLMLRKVEDNFVLLDLQTNQYIFPGNKGADDNITTLENRYLNTRKVNFNTTAVAKEQKESKEEIKPAIVKKEETLPAFNPEAKHTKTEKVKAPKEVKEKTVTEKPAKITKTKEEKPKKEDKPKPKYLENVVINKENQNSTEEEEYQGGESTATVIGSCQTPMTNKEFDSYLEKLKSKDDEARIKFVTRSKKQCFSTEQISYIGRAIPSSSGRLQVLQQLYHQTTDKQNFEMLEHLFKTEYLKKKFKESIPK